MERKLVLISVIVILLTSLLGVAFRVETVQASGTIYIRADGSIDPPTANITTADNVTYTFTDNNYDGIVVEKNNIVIDGTGFSVQGTGAWDSEGVHLSNTFNVTIRNIDINWFYDGIYVYNSSSVCLYRNNITLGKGSWHTAIQLKSSSNSNISKNSVNPSGVTGLMLQVSSDNIISENRIINSGVGIQIKSGSNHNNIFGNNLTNNDKGITLSSSSNNTVAKNMISGCEYSFGVEGSFQNHFNHSIDISNSIDGKPVYYLVGQKNTLVNPATHPEIGFLGLVNCSNVTVRDLILTNNGQGLLLAFTQNSRITGNIIADNWNGIQLLSSPNNTLSENNVTRNTNGIVTQQSSNHVIINGNSITNNTGWGLYFRSSSYSCVSENEISRNTNGILLEYSSNNSINENNIANNYEASYSLGIRLSSSTENTITGNNIMENGNGVYCSKSNRNIILENDITENIYGIWLSEGSSSNRFCHNNIIDNSEQIFLTTMFPPGENVWDNGYPSGGNYWSDYIGNDMSHDGLGSPEYFININNIDRYPLMGLFSSFNATTEHFVQTICNSTITDFQYNNTAFSFNVSGENGAAGFCRICIPTALMNDTYQVFVNGTEVPYDLLPCSNSTHGYLYFTYEHSTNEVVIVPEFSLVLLPLFMLSTLLAAMICARTAIC